MEEYKLYINALEQKDSTDKIEPVIVEQFQELIVEQFVQTYNIFNKLCQNEAAKN